ncbi:MAG: NAD(P)/FAD-dependent oxidoreductase [Betaproteobacteria bacterium]
MLGAGAAGMMCAATAGQRGRRVLIVEHYHRVGEKIRISGGGRCNFTNLGAAPANYLSGNPDFCRSALARYTPRHFVALVERHGIRWHEKKLGQLFCDVTALDIIRMLRAECDRGRVEWRQPCPVDGVAKEGDGFVVATPQGAVRARSLVVATGGLTVPKVGATPFAYRLAAQFGVPVVAPRPALVPLAFAPVWLARYGELSGVSIDVAIRCGAGDFRENLLFTHRGLSGPAILQASSYWDGREPLSIDLAPDAKNDWLAARSRSDAHLANVLAERLPRRFAQQWCEGSSIDRPLRELGEARLRVIASGLRDWQVLPSGTLGYAKAEVTLGGVDTRALSSRTMAVRDVPGLHVIGEAVDVTGWLGGFNFQWAWSSGVAAGLAA